MPTVPLRDRTSRKALEPHQAEIGGRHLRELFAENPGRGERMCADTTDPYLDDSKNGVTDETPRLLIEFAHDSSTNVLIRHYRRLKEI